MWVVKLFKRAVRSCTTYVIGTYMVSTLYLILLGVYLYCIRSIYTNLIFSCRCYPCFVVYINYLILRHLNYSYVEMQAHFCNVCNLRLNMWNVYSSLRS